MENIAIVEEVKGFIENSLICYELDNRESLFFLSGKIDEGFLWYLLLELEERYKIVFEDDSIHVENFDSVEAIAEMVNKYT